MSSYNYVGARCKKGQCEQCLDTSCFHSCHKLEHPNKERANRGNK